LLCGGADDYSAASILAMGKNAAQNVCPATRL
jgi:hypothetical protein